MDRDAEFVELRRPSRAPSYRYHSELDDDQFLSDGVSKIDFILVRRQRQSSPDVDHRARQKIFEQNLESEGLIMETVDGDNASSPIFVKIHAPWDVLRRYAEILKIRMPMKKLSCLSGRKHLLERLPGMRHMTRLADDVDRAMFQPDTEKFPPKHKYLTAVYSRNQEYLFDMHEDFFPGEVRSRIVMFILQRMRFVDVADGDRMKGGLCFGIDRLLSDETYLAAFPLHEGSASKPGNMRYLLKTEWCSVRKLFKYQPLDYIEQYFGSEIALYFTWLGFYTYSLILPTIVGVICFVYGIVNMYHDIPSNDICNDKNTVMCPLCDHHCDFWKLNSTCSEARITSLVDNPSTVFFAIFMSFWAALFLEFWKRYVSETLHRWNLTSFELIEEYPSPVFLDKMKNLPHKINVITKQLEPLISFWRIKFPRLVVSASVILLLLAVALSAVFGVIVYRIAMLASIRFQAAVLGTSTLFLINVSAAFLNLVFVLLITRVSQRVAIMLTELELPRTRSEFKDSLTLKIYLLKFVNYYSSILYIAFFKGRFVGSPQDYQRFFGYRQEECGPGGCLAELTIQLSVIMVGKQIMLSIWEMVLPNMFNLLRRAKRILLCQPAERKDSQREEQWVADHNSLDVDYLFLIWEYLEMVTQFGLITIFVASFPLAPLFALLNNTLEMRLDAYKLLVFYRRPVAQQARDIGIWLRILNTIGKVSVLTNACIIAFTSSFIPRLVYKFTVSDDNSLSGFMTYSLSLFKITDFPDHITVASTADAPQTCWYKDYRYGPDHESKYLLTPFFWKVLVARLLFVVLFQNTVYAVISFIKWITPDIPRDLKARIMQENYLVQEMIVKLESHHAKGGNVEDLKDNLLDDIIEPSAELYADQLRNCDETVRDT